MDTLPLPPHPDLAQYRKRAKDLVTAANARNDDAVRAWAKKWLESLARLLKVEITPPYRAALERAIDVLETRVRKATTIGSEFSLASAQFVIATAHGFENWSTFVTHLDQASSEYRGTARAERSRPRSMRSSRAIWRHSSRSCESTLNSFELARRECIEQRCCTMSPRTASKTFGSAHRPTRWKSHASFSRWAPRSTRSPAHTAVTHFKPR